MSSCVFLLDTDSWAFPLIPHFMLTSSVVTGWPNIGTLRTSTPSSAPDLGNQFLGALQHLAQSLVAIQQLPAPPRVEKVKVWEPDTFDGSDPWKLCSFLLACNLHFWDQPYAFPNDEKKILFVLSYLNGSAISWFEPGLMTHPTLCTGCGVLRPSSMS